MPSGSIDRGSGRGRRRKQGLPLLVGQAQPGRLHRHDILPHDDGCRRAGGGDRRRGEHLSESGDGTVVPAGGDTNRSAVGRGNEHARPGSAAEGGFSGKWPGHLRTAAEAIFVGIGSGERPTLDSEIPKRVSVFGSIVKRTSAPVIGLLIGQMVARQALSMDIAAFDAGRFS